MAGIDGIRQKTDALVRQIRTDELRSWLERQEHPYLKHAMAVLDFERRSAEDPSAAAPYLSIAETLHKNGNYGMASKYFEMGLQRSPNDIYGLMTQASLYATCPDASYRDGRKAVRNAATALQLAEETGTAAGYLWLRRYFLQILAAAYAEAGKVEIED